MERLNVDNILCALLEDDSEERGKIFRKVLDNGREVFTCKCPVCGTYHGGFKTYDEAAAHRKCSMCFGKEIEKLKKEVEKVDEPPKRKDIFTDRIAKPSVIGEDLATVYKNSVYEADEDIRSILGGDPYEQPPGVVNKAVCMAAHYNQTFYHRTEKNADGSPLRVRVSGRCKTWATRPDEYRLPVKYGLYQSLAITERNASEWTTINPREQ